MSERTIGILVTILEDIADSPAPAPARPQLARLLAAEAAEIGMAPTATELEYALRRAGH